MARHQAAGTYGRIAALFTVAFLVVLVVLALLGQFGLPETLLGTILGGATILTFAIVGLTGGTLDASEFHLAGRALSPAAAGMASAAGVIGGALYLGLAGLNLTDTWTAAAIVMGWCLGFLVLAVGIAPYIRKSGAFGVTDFLGIRYGGRWIRLVTAVVVILALFAALAAALATGAFVAADLFRITLGSGLVIVTALVLVGTVLGGMRTITPTAILQYIVMAVAFLVPVAIVSAREFTLPIPQFTFGYAFDEALLYSEASGIALAQAIAGSELPATAANLVAIVLCVAAGVAVLPHLAFRSTMVRSVAGARRAPGFALLFVLVIALTAPAYAAFAKLVVMRDLAGMALETLPGWIFEYGAAGLIRICGATADSIAAVLTACRAAPGFTGNLSPADLALGADALVLAAPDIFELPYVASALIALGALAAVTATASAIAFALGGAVGHDFYGSVVNTRASAGRKLIVTRLLVAIFVLAAAWVAANRPDDAYALALSAIALSASALFPPVILGIWWKRMNATGAVAGVVAGAVVALAIVVENRYPGTLPAFLPNPGRVGFDGITAALFGLPVGFIATVAGSLLTAAPDEIQDRLVDAIRRPGGIPFIQESES